MLQYTLGSMEDHTVFEAEVVGLLLGLHMVMFEREGRKAIIQIDNQVVLGAIVCCKPSSVQYIIDEAIPQIGKIWSEVNDPAIWLEIAWVRGHSGKEGNKKVDVAAKEVARGKSSQVHNLPKFLAGRVLPKSIATQRQKHAEKIMES